MLLQQLRLLLGSEINSRLVRANNQNCNRQTLSNNTKALAIKKAKVSKKETGFQQRQSPPSCFAKDSLFPWQTHKYQTRAPLQLKERQEEHMDSRKSPPLSQKNE
jgi:hypothetical protein